MWKNVWYYLIALGIIIIITVCFRLFAKAGVDCGGRLCELGWEVEEPYVEAVKIHIPYPFDEVYRNYNEIQKECGFDLEPYAGCDCMRYTYNIMNYPDCSDEVMANIIVYDGVIIGGDICTVQLGGFMHGLKARKEL